MNWDISPTRRPAPWSPEEAGFRSYRFRDYQPFFPEIVQVFENIAVQHNYEILITSTAHEPKRMESSVRRMLERRVEGVAVMTFGMEESLLDDLKLRNVPLSSWTLDRRGHESAISASTIFTAYARRCNTWRLCVTSGLRL